MATEAEAYELIFWGGTREPYEREHDSFEEARDEARRVLSLIEDRAAHPAIIYGPAHFEKTIR
jgi:hypothetical protein